MKFGRVAVAAGEGLILAHAVRARSLTLKKGEVITPAHIAALEAAGITTIVGARLETDDVTENVAALRLAETIAGPEVRLERPFTGRCNLLANTAGLVRIDVDLVNAVNAVDESITLATLPPMQSVVEGEMIATVKVIPFAVPQAYLAASLAMAPRFAVSILPFRPMRLGVISTLLPGLKPTTVTKTLKILESRIEPAKASIAQDLRVDHDVHALAEAIRTLRDVDILVVFGASAITDRRDVVPAALQLAGGEVDHLGMPVDPGNLLMLGRVPVRPGVDIPVIGAPGCARSPKENGFDFVLRRQLAGLNVTGTDLRRMGVGGLLNEIVSRPQLRQVADG